MLSLLWIIPVSLGITWVAFRVLQIFALFVCGLFEWFWTPQGKRAIDRGITGGVFWVMGIVSLCIVLKVIGLK